VTISNKSPLCQYDSRCKRPPYDKEAFCLFHFQSGEKRLHASLSGSEPPFTPEVWNKPGYQTVHNCFAYALNILSKILADTCINKKVCNTHQPGEVSKWPAMTGKTCPNLIARILGDGQYSAQGTYTDGQYIPIEYDQRCPKGTSKIAFIIDTKHDYHVLRVDDTGYISHKGGQGPVTDRDAQGHKIADVRRANFNYSDKPDRLNYTHFCGYFCISRLVVHAAVPKGGNRYRKTRRISSVRQNQSALQQKKNKTRLLRRRNGMLGGVRGIHAEQL
jgi:hypothetical protein